MKSRAALRQEVQALLTEGKFPELVSLAGRESFVSSILLQFLYDPANPLHWRALEGLGHVAHGHPNRCRSSSAGSSGCSTKIPAVSAGARPQPWGKSGAMSSRWWPISSPCFAVFWKRPSPGSPCSGVLAGWPRCIRRSSTKWSPTFWLAWRIAIPRSGLNCLGPGKFTGAAGQGAVKKVAGR